MRVWVLVGPPGAGKGTQAKALSEKLGLPHISSGDLFRSNIASDTPLGRQAKGYMEQGALVPDDVTIKMIEQRLAEADAADGAILDGFPRTPNQAEALATMLARKGGRVAGALYIDVDRDVLLRRISGRWVCRDAPDHVYHAQSHPPRKAGRCDIDGSPLFQREDDKPQTVKARLDKQLPPMFEVVAYYNDHGLLSTVDGDQPIEDVTEALLRAIDVPASASAR